MNSYDIIGDEVRSFWKKTHPQPVVAFFRQKYEWEKEWENCAEVVFAKISENNEIDVIFENDFCEGQTDVDEISIVPLKVINEFFFDIFDNWGR